MKSALFLYTENPSFIEPFESTFSEGFLVYSYNNIDVLIKEISVTLPTLIILDLNLSNSVVGLNTLKKLKSNASIFIPPVILLTDSITDEILVKSFEIGVIDLIVKPVNLKILFLKSLNNLIDIGKKRLEMLHLSHYNGLEDLDTPEVQFKKQFEKIIQIYIAEDVDISIKKIAGEMLMSVSTFERWMKRIYGMTPHKYINGLRFSRADILLRKKKGSIKEIANLLGFSSVSYFITSFKDHFGMSPRMYAKKYGETV